MSERYNCPNCGAPIGYAPRCQYCGTLLNWIPVTVEFIAQPMNVKKLVGSVKYTKDMIRGFDDGFVRREAERRLSSDFAQKIPDVWDLQIFDDPIIDGKDYRATLYVCVKETQKEADDGIL